jgi:hypothetical protein
MMEHKPSCRQCQHLKEGAKYTHWRTGKLVQIYTCAKQRRAVTMAYNGRQAATCQHYREQEKQEG